MPKYSYMYYPKLRKFGDNLVICSSVYTNCIFFGLNLKHENKFQAFDQGYKDMVRMLAKQVDPVDLVEFNTVCVKVYTDFVKTFVGLNTI